MSYPVFVKWLQPSMALRTGSDKDTRRGTEGAHTSTHTEPRSTPSRNSTSAQVLPSPDSLPSTNRVEQSLDTCGMKDTFRRQVGKTPIKLAVEGHYLLGLFFHFQMLIVSFFLTESRLFWFILSLVSLFPAATGS